MKKRFHKNITFYDSETRHTIAYCTLCMYVMVHCKHCHNNSCNGGSGENCPDQCKSAYEFTKFLHSKEGKKLIPLRFKIREYLDEKWFIYYSYIRIWFVVPVADFIYKFIYKYETKFFKRK